MENVNVQLGNALKYSDLIGELLDMGYDRVEEVDRQGTFSIRGGNILIWPALSLVSFVIEYFGDEIESIKSYATKEAVKSLVVDSLIVKYEDGTFVKPGDYVVHIDHGIAIYAGMEPKLVDSKIINYFVLEFLNKDKLYLPCQLYEKMTKYIGVGRKPKLNRLGSQSWQNAKKRAYHNAIKLAQELIHIYAKRELAAKVSYAIDTEYDTIIKKGFGFTETPDQDKAIREVYSDISKNRPMDRLISGDVGFGKTEVALRAMVQAVANRKQAVLICPTTILCQQHYANVLSRTKELPINIAMLSRFVSAAEQREIIKDIKTGKVDIVIGTHRLLSKEIEFKCLDLVVLDEEQRFGVKQKEHFKKLREEMNILSLSATPIPRTLFMSLSGIRDISQINTPPKGRRAIETKIELFSDEIIKRYIDQEIKRGGQVYYLYNRVETIEGLKNKLTKLMPNIKFTVGHGQMPEGSLSKIMSSFAKGESDVLICTTIIENGLDLPNVNTLIVEGADNFGLSQLYQIRGRVGRSGRQAYCLLTHREKKLVGNAYKRLKSLVDNTELGSGFNVALSDLEIRGGGNVLGREQHGNLETVGLILYSQMLKRAVDKLSQQAALV